MLQDLRRIWQNEFFRNVATLLSGTTLAQVFSVLIYLVLARIYTEDDFGIFGLYMNILNITVIFSTGKYELTILLPKSDRESVNLLGLSGLISVGVSMVLFLVVATLRFQIGQWLGAEEIVEWLWLIPLSTLLVGLFQSLRNFSNRQKRYRLITGANVVQSLGNSLMKLVLGLVIVGSAGLIFGVVFGQLVGFLLFFLVHLKQNREKLQWMNSGEMGRLARQYSLFPRYNMWQGLVNNVSGALPVFIFSSYFSTAIAGIYTFGYMLVYRPVNLVATAFYQVLYQRFSEKYNKGESILAEAKLYILRAAQILIIPFILFAIFAPDLFGFVFGDKWFEAGRYARILVPWIFMVALTMPLSFVPDLYRKQRVATAIDSVRLVLRLGSLVVGVVTENVYLGLGLLSGVSALVIIWSLSWYIWLIRKNEQIGKSPEGTVVDPPETGTSESGADG